MKNPHIRIANEEVGTQLFAGPDITRIPYGRGMFYLMGIDTAIRSATQGKQSLDDVLFSMIARYRQNPENREPGMAGRDHLHSWQQRKEHV